MSSVSAAKSKLPQRARMTQFICLIIMQSEDGLLLRSDSSVIFQNQSASENLPGLTACWDFFCLHRPTLAIILPYRSRRPVIESLMLLVCMLTDPQWWMCRLASFLQWIRTQIAFLISEIISTLWNISDIMQIIQKKMAWIGPICQQEELSSWCDGTIPPSGTLCYYDIIDFYDIIVVFIKIYRYNWI